MKDKNISRNSSFLLWKILERLCPLFRLPMTAYCFICYNYLHFSWFGRTLKSHCFSLVTLKERYDRWERSGGKGTFNCNIVVSWKYFQKQEHKHRETWHCVLKILGRVRQKKTVFVENVLSFISLTTYSYNVKK